MTTAALTRDFFLNFGLPNNRDEWKQLFENNIHPGQEQILEELKDIGARVIKNISAIKPDDVHKDIQYWMLDWHDAEKHVRQQLTNTIRHIYAEPGNPDPRPILTHRSKVYGEKLKSIERHTTLATICDLAIEALQVEQQHPCPRIKYVNNLRPLDAVYGVFCTLPNDWREKLPVGELGKSVHEVQEFNSRNAKSFLKRKSHNNFDRDIIDYRNRRNSINIELLKTAQSLLPIEKHNWELIDL